MKLIVSIFLALVLSACASSPTKIAPPKDISGKSFVEENNLLLQRAKDNLEKILAVKGPRTIENTLVPYNQLSLDIDTTYGNTGLFSATHPDKEIRDQALQQEQVLDKFTTALSLNVDLYNAVKAVDVSQADEATKFFYEKTLRGFRRSGVDKDEATRQKIASLQEELSKVSQEFSKNIRDDVRYVDAKPEQLKGLPQDFIDSHPVKDGIVKISTNYPDYLPVMRYAEDPKLREELYVTFRNRAYPVNSKVLKELMQKRYELAQLLGYKNWAEYVTEDKMMKSPKAADEFIDRISELAKSRSQKDYQELLQEKRKVYPKAKRVYGWESSYWSRLLKESKYELDSKEVRNYFEFNKVKKGVFEITQKLFGVTYKKVTDVKLWHQDVEAWDIYDNKRWIGRFYLDLFPRDNKYKHAAQFPFRTGVDGAQLPQAVLVTNFPNPRESSPALMEHSDVETFLHEFGHLLHTIFGGHQKWADISGIKTEWDFVETPSQMLEEWIWDTSTLQSFAKHHKTDEAIPESLIKKMRAAEEFGKGINVRHQMFYAALSLNMYNKAPEKVNIDKLSRQLQNQYSPFSYEPKTHFAESFGHLDGYSAMYYTYMWSQVIAKDLFSEFEKNGLFDMPTAQRYRDKILSRGGSGYAGDLVKDFLGRPFSYEAFQKWLN